MKTKLTILLSFLSFGIFAQNATWDYLVTQTGSTPVSMSGATLLGMGGDDVGYALHWPFNFSIYNSAYTTSDSISLTSNGYLRFDGPLALNARNTIIPTNSTTYGQFISYGGNTDGLIDSLITYKISGTAPNRILTIAFTYYTYYILQQTCYHADIQISFYESDYKIKLDLSNTGGSNYPAGYLGINAGDGIFATNIGYFPSTDTAYIFEVPGSVPPVQNFTALNQGAIENILNWTSPSSPNVMIAVNDINYFPNPVNGNSYSIGNQLTGSNAKIIYKGNATTYTHKGLFPYTNYFYKIWTIDSLTNYSTGKSDAAMTSDALCMATVDTSSSFVIIKWDPNWLLNMDSIYIYRVNNYTYNKIGMVHAGAASFFNDLNTNPDSLSYSYAINAKDSTGNYSGYSPIHETIHLNVDTIGHDSLYWNPYFGKPIWFYFIYCGNSTGNMILVDSISPMHPLAYTFLSGSWKYFQVAGYTKDFCGSDSLIFSNIFGKTNTNNINLPKSNSSAFHIYPNPANKNVFLRFDKRITNGLNIEIYNNLSMKIFEKKTSFEPNQNVEIDLSGFSKGIYYIAIRGQGIYEMKKLIIH